MARLRDRDWPVAAALWTALLFTFLPTGPPAHAFSHQRPFWTEQAMFRFGGDVFFVGRASCMKSEEDGRDQSFQHALQELLNYAQVSSAAGFSIETQMLFQERDSAGCPAGTLSVWRLLRVGEDQVASLAKVAASRLLREGPVAATPPRVLSPQMGMSREQVLQRFGRAASISMRKGGVETIWHYPRLRLVITFDEDDVVIGWKLAGQDQRGEIANPRVVESQPAVDLTSRLRDLEKMPDSQLNIVYNQAQFPLGVPFATPPDPEVPVTRLPRYTEAKPAPRSRTPEHQAPVLEKPFSELSPFEAPPAGGEASSNPYSSLYDSQNRIIPRSPVRVGLQIANY